jgi:hypothetical protein
MKLLLDTCALIWYLSEDSRLLPEVYEQIARFIGVYRRTSAVNHSYLNRIDV